MAIEPFTRNAGTASALMGSMQMAAGALGSALVSYFHNGTALPMAGLLMLSSLLSLCLQVGYHVRERRDFTRHSDPERADRVEGEESRT